MPEISPSNGNGSSLFSLRGENVLFPGRNRQDFPLIKIIRMVLGSSLIITGMVCMFIGGCFYRVSLGITGMAISAVGIEVILGCFYRICCTNVCCECKSEEQEETPAPEVKIVPEFPDVPPDYWSCAANSYSCQETNGASSSLSDLPSYSDVVYNARYSTPYPCTISNDGLFTEPPVPNSVE